MSMCIRSLLTVAVLFVASGASSRAQLPESIPRPPALNGGLQAAPSAVHQADTGTEGVLIAGACCHQCGNCAECGAPDLCHLHSHCEVGYDFVFIRPRLETPSRFNYEPSPRMWLGWTNCDGVGLRTRYWQFDQRAGADSLELHRTDIELTKQCGWGNTSLLFTAGISHSRIEATTASVFDSFDGVGPALGVEVWWPFAFCGWTAFARTRGTMLLGREILSLGQLLAASDDALFSLDIALGLDWRRDVPWLGGQLFARVGYEGQAWGDDGITLLQGLEGYSFTFGLDR